MPIGIRCEARDCMYNKDEECTRIKIVINDNSYCDDFEEKDEEEE